MKVRLSNLCLLAAVVCLLCGPAFAQAPLPFSAEHPIVTQPAPPAVDQSRADEWKRREILESQHGRSTLEINSVGYLEIIVVPLLVFILLLGVVRMKDF